VKLLIDIGNTRVKWAGLVDGELVDDDGLVHDADPAGAAATLLERVNAPPDAIALSNVAGPAFADKFLNGIRARWGCPVQVAVTQPVAGRVCNAYADHAKLGVDRWLAMLAAAHRYPGALCIVDAGTAVTIDIVAASGEHQGGYIVPGLDLMWRALAGETSDLGRFTAGDEAGRAESLEFGRNTGDAIGRGSLASICALIERCAGGLGEDNGGVVVVTGGAAGRIIPHLAVDLEHRPLLVLEGLALWKPG